MARTNPLTRLREVDVDTRRQLLDDATRWLRFNLERSRRTTVPQSPDGTLWVYGRDGQPCRVCGTAVVGAKLGDGARPTYWCPRCQPATSRTQVVERGSVT